MLGQKEFSNAVSATFAQDTSPLASFNLNPSVPGVWRLVPIAL